MKFSLSVAALLHLGSCATVLLEKVKDIPQGWRLVTSAVDPEERLVLSFALREPEIHQLRQKIAGPSAVRLTRSDVEALRAPDPNDVDEIQRWLASNGINSTSQKDDWIHVRTTVGQAERLLEMKMGRWQYRNKTPNLRTREYTIPESLQYAIKFVHPISNFMTPTKELTTRRPLPSKSLSKIHARGIPCEDSVTPECIRELYNIPKVDPSAESSIRLGVAGFLEEYANYIDLELFLNQSAPDIAATGYNFSVELVNGGQNSQNPREAGGEAALDIDYAMALGFPTNVTYFSTGGRGEKLDDDGNPITDEEMIDNEPYLEFLEYLLAKPDNEIPHVLSFSYADNELSVPRPYADRVCNMFGLLTGRGTSVLAGSGDGGSAGSRNSSCRTPDRKEVTMAVFPASCPWVTAVGAVNHNGIPPQGATFSGGGFSQYFPREAWQDGVVDDYVQNLNGHLNGKYNASMRATPDISVVGVDFEVVVARTRNSFSGTSASTPLLAAMIALINDERVKAGKDVLGWLNEKLYRPEVREILQDTTLGFSQSCMFANGSTPGGWPAKQGWDAITGLGVPNDFQKLLHVLVDA